MYYQKVAASSVRWRLYGSCTGEKQWRWNRLLGERSRRCRVDVVV